MLQEGFIRVFRYINQYKFEGSFEGWLKRIIVNAALRILQKKVIHFTEVNEELQDLQQAFEKTNTRYCVVVVSVPVL